MISMRKDKKRRYYPFLWWSVEYIHYFALLHTYSIMVICYIYLFYDGLLHVTFHKMNACIVHLCVWMYSTYMCMFYLKKKKKAKERNTVYSNILHDKKTKQTHNVYGRTTPDLCLNCHSHFNIKLAPLSVQLSWSLISSQQWKGWTAQLCSSTHCV